MRLPHGGVWQLEKSGERAVITKKAFVGDLVDHIFHVAVGFTSNSFLFNFTQLAKAKQRTRPSPNQEYHLPFVFHCNPIWTFLGCCKYKGFRECLLVLCICAPRWKCPGETLCFELTREEVRFKWQHCA
eukprot:2467967-Amphidinium_carterae.1